MAKRKKNPTAEEPTGREKKKLKMAVARTIEVQSVAERDNTRSHTTTTDGLKDFPSVIDVERFTEARAFEIDAMHKAMKNASGTSAQRAWQALPRHLRRRAASHDVRRVPLRLRDRAQQEMDPVRRKASGYSLPKRGKARQMSRTESFLKRQRDKTWLETHIWHAKRMKMENMWGYRLAVHTTEKSFRPSHRASVHGSIIHDASYYSLIEIKGPESTLRTLFETCCDCQGPSPAAPRFMTGSRVMETHIYKPRTYPFGLIAPIAIIWKPNRPDPDPGMENELQEPADVFENTGKRRKRRDKEKGKEKETEVESDPDVPRTVWIRSHPVVFEDVFSALQTSASLTLDAFKKCPQNKGKEVEVELADLRGQVNAFEIMGSKSSQVIKGAVTPVSGDKREEFKKFWTFMNDLQSSGSLPRGMIIGFKVYDPRLKFPPKNAKPRVGEPSTNLTIPSSTLAHSEIWDETIRSRLGKPRYEKKDLDHRRAKHLVPGTSLRPLRQDDRIPILLIQRSLGSSPIMSDSQGLHGWTLIIPAGWSMAFFSSLTFTGTRVGGQRECRTQSFEAGSAYFPHDYPSTAAYYLHADANEAEEKARWERKPPAKRPNFEKLGTRSPWIPDWEVVLGIENFRKRAEEGEAEYVTTDREVSPVVSDEAKVGPWLLRGPELLAILSRLSKMFNPAAGLWAEINKLRTKRRGDQLSARIKAEVLWESAVVRVRVMICGRGVPEDLALIYAVDDEEARKWNKVIERRKKFDSPVNEESPDEADLSDIRPSQDSIIGYVTTGHYSLSRGEGFSIGAISVSRLFEIREQSHRLHAGVEAVSAFNSKALPLLVKVRQRDADRCRAAHLELRD